MSAFGILSKIVALLVGITVHEFGHGLVSHKLGDPTPAAQGRLTLNPLAHLDPFGTVIFPLLLLLGGSRFLFGWAKPVQVHPGYWRSWRQGNLLVSLAGPGMNMAAALAAGLLLRLVGPTPMMATLAIDLVLTNLALAFFNLIPIPPLDGSHVAESLLPPHLAQQYDRIKPYGFLILIVLIYLGAFSIVLGPLVMFSARLILG